MNKREHLNKLVAEAKALRAEIKAEEKASTVYYYTLNKGEVISNKATALPEHGSFAFWSGNSGEKVLNITPSFKQALENCKVVKGYHATRIKPILKQMGYAYDTSQTAWVRA